MYKRRPDEMLMCKERLDEDQCVKEDHLISPCVKEGFFCRISARLLGYLIDRVDKKDSRLVRMKRSRCNFGYKRRII